MKKTARLSIGCLLVVFLASRGAVGHRTISLIAERHLTQQAKDNIHSLLGDTIIADIASVTMIFLRL